MQIFLISTLVFGCIMLLMSVGVIMGRKPIVGGCGGMSAVALGGSCSLCGGKPSACESSDSNQDQDLAYDATKH